LPIDRADPRISDKNWFKNEWDKHVPKWNKWAAEKRHNITFGYWGETEISERLSQEKHAGRHLFRFNKELSPINGSWIN